MSTLNLRLKIQGRDERTISVRRNVFNIGRSPDCDLHLPFSSISRRHLRLSKTALGKWTVEDLGSTIGTLLNGQPLKAVGELQNGDVIQLGSITIGVVSIEPSPRRTMAASSNRLDGQKPASPPPRMSETILRNVNDLKQQWLTADRTGGAADRNEKIIARLTELVDIAKGLNAAESIEDIFSEVQKVAFRELSSIDRLALLVDVGETGNPEVVNVAARSKDQQQFVWENKNWISRTICRQAFSDRVAIHTPDAQTDSRFKEAESIVMKGISCAMAVPLWDEKKVVGVLYADAHRSFLNWEKEGEEDLGYFSTLANLVASSTQRWLLARKLRNEEDIRQKLQRYHSPAVVQHMMAVKCFDDGRLPPDEREISILFADIVGFTALAERLPPWRIAKLLNAFFEEMLQEIFKLGGTLDKFIGDCIMAFFGAPEPQADHADRAVKAVRAMLDRLDRLNAQQTLGQSLQLRVAINSGRAIVGDVGSSQRMEYTVLGSVINKASRMETVCPSGTCIISESTYSRISSPGDFEFMGEHQLKGIENPVPIYRMKRS